MNLFPSSINAVPESVVQTELARVLAITRRRPVDCERRRVGGKLSYSPETQALVEVMTERFAVPRLLREDGQPSCTCAAMGHPCITQLNAAQAWTLREIAKIGGGLGFIPVGEGKTILAILAPLALGVQCAVLLAKSDQRLHYRRAWERLREHFRVPSMVIDDGGAPMISKGAPVLHFVPYSKLSRPESTKLLADLNPDLVIADEVHCLANTVSARTLRWFRFMASRTGLRFCGWSGTLLDKSLRSVAHLSAHALGSCSPFPINPNNVEAWASVIDPSTQPDRASSTAKALYEAFGSIATEEQSVTDIMLGAGIRRVREGFRKRLVETPGIIATRASSVTCSITVHERQVKMPDNVRQALAQARAWTRPDGEELVEAVEQARCAREVASGFYAYWAYPNGEPEDLIQEWFSARQDFNREMRERILRGEEYLDSRKLCENAADRAWQSPSYEGDLPTWMAPTWPRWRDVKERVRHDSRVKWIDDYLAKDAAEWAQAHRGIVWCLSVAMGKRIAQIAKIPYYGDDSEREILADEGKTSIVASIRAHSEGRDSLQFKFHEQLVVEVPSGGKTWGQMLGRLCRQGQPEDTVDTWVYLHFHEAKDALRKAVAQAEYAEEMTPVESLLIAADFTFDL